MNKPERVLHVVSSMNRGGAETMIMNLYRNIDKNKLQFDFICHTQDKCDFEDEIHSLGGKIYRIDSLGKSGLLKYIKNLKFVIKYKGPFKAIHAHTDIQSGIVALAARLSGIKKRITHSHSTELQYRNSLKNKLYYYILSYIARIFSTDYCACSIKAGEFLYGKTSKNKINVINNGIDLNKFMNEYNSDIIEILKNENDIKKDEIIIGQVGRFESVKNHDFTIEIAKILKSNNIKFKILMVGEGTLFNKIKNSIIENDLDEHIKLLGLRHDVENILNMIDIFLMPSIYEGIPLSIIEAQACGRKCIISDRIDLNSDIGLNLVTSLDIENSHEIWANSIIDIYNSRSYEVCSKTLIEKRFNETGYNILNNIDKIYDLYNI